jgi:hypothetical protein
MVARRDPPNTRLKPGQKVLLKALPKGFLDDLPHEDKQAISDAMDKPILLRNYDSSGRAELEFTDEHGVIHFVYVDPKFLGRVAQ